MALFKKKKASENSIKNSVTMVEEILKKNGLNPDDNRSDGQDYIGWILVKGSAIIYIQIANNNGIDTISITSPILYLPQENILPFYRRCLEINYFLVNAALAVRENIVSVVSERPLEGLDSIEIDSMLIYLGNVADNLDNKLADEFGAKILSAEEGIPQN